MRGDDRQQQEMWSYVSAEDRIPEDHPLRVMRTIVNTVLRDLSPLFSGLYSNTGRPSIAPERLLRALLLQLSYTIRSERLLMEQLNYNILFRWFVGLEMDDPVWAPTVFTKNRDRLLDGDVAEAFFVNTVLRDLSPLFSGLYSNTGRPSIAPERLLRALLLQLSYTIRSERLLMEQLNYNILFRWFVVIELLHQKAVV